MYYMPSDIRPKNISLISMVIHFHINYRANDGESLELLYGGEQPTSLRLHSHDGCNWKGQLEVNPHGGTVNASP